jgi:hypothetical protein
MAPPVPGLTETTHLQRLPTRDRGRVVDATVCSRDARRRTRPARARARAGPCLRTPPRTSHMRTPSRRIIRECLVLRGLYSSEPSCPSSPFLRLDEEGARQSALMPSLVSRSSTRLSAAPQALGQRERPWRHATRWRRPPAGYARPLLTRSHPSPFHRLARVSKDTHSAVADGGSTPGPRDLQGHLRASKWSSLALPLSGYDGLTTSLPGLLPIGRW